MLSLSVKFSGLGFLIILFQNEGQCVNTMLNVTEGQTFTIEAGDGLAAVWYGTLSGRNILLASCIHDACTNHKTGYSASSEAVTYGDNTRRSFILYKYFLEVIKVSPKLSRIELGGDTWDIVFIGNELSTRSPNTPGPEINATTLITTTTPKPAYKSTAFWETSPDIGSPSTNIPGYTSPNTPGPEINATTLITTTTTPKPAYKSTAFWGTSPDPCFMCDIGSSSTQIPGYISSSNTWDVLIYVSASGLVLITLCISVLCCIARWKAAARTQERSQQGVVSQVHVVPTVDVDPPPVYDRMLVFGVVLRMNQGPTALPLRQEYDRSPDYESLPPSYESVANLY